VNHRHRKVLYAVFAHPLNHNIDPTLLRHVFEELGAEIRETGAGSTQVTLNGKVRAFHLGQHSVPGEVVMQVRHFLKDAGVDPEAYPV
jgi:shikimate 5-dehydrogenase